MSNKAVKTFYNLHRRIGIFVSIHFILLALTGSILLFKDELTGHAGHEHHEKTILPENLQSLLDQAKTLAPTSRPLTLTLKDEDTLELRLGTNGSKKYRQSHRLYFDKATLAPKEYKSLENTPMDFILRFHREFLLGSGGKIYVGFIGLLYTFTLLSGFLIYGPFHKKLGFGEIRRASPRATYSDLHKYLGMVTLGWALIIGVSGALLGFSSTLIKIFQYQELQVINQKFSEVPNSPWANLDLVLKNAQDKIPEGSFDFLAFPDTEFSPPGHFLVLMHGEGLKERLIDIAVVESTTGQVEEVRELPWYLKITAISEPLHFGNYGGLPLKLIWLFMTLATMMLPILGLMLTFRKKLSEMSATKKQSISKNKTQKLLPANTPDKVYRGVFVASLAGILGCFFIFNNFKFLFLALMLIPVILIITILKIRRR